MPVTAPSPGTWAGRLRTERSADRPRALTALLRSQVASVLGHDDVAGVAADKTFKDLGFDSLTAVELRNRIAARTELSLPATLVFEFPSIASLSGYLLESLFPVGKTTTAPTELPVGPVAGDADPVVIVGMGCRYPGGVRSPEDLWSVVSGGVDAIGEFPGDRGWDVDRLFDPDPDHHGTSYTRRGGFLYDAGEFDAAFFGMSPREALATDPQQRLLLQVSWEALERAGVDPLSLKGSDTAVFIGAMYDDYAARLRTAPRELEGLLLAGNQSSVASGRIAYSLGLHGRALTVDTACSSSLVALDLAVRAVASGECSLALAGGVAVMASPGMFVEFSRQRGLSADGRCRAFGAGAAGTGWAEGVGMLVVERLSEARRRGHPVLAVVAGSAVNQDGASNGLTAPSGRAQEKVIRQALTGAGLSFSDVDAVEAHGTGTKLGDPIEARALIATYGRDRGEDRPLWVGSLKSNIGHAQAAAGVGGVIKMVLALRHEVLPRTLHADQPSEHVAWEGSGLALLTEPVPWPHTGRPRRAGISSFGISGTNTHVVLEEPPAPPETPHTAEPPAVTPLVLSAKAGSAVKAQAALLADALDRSGAGLADAGLTLARRPRFAHRAVVTGADRADLVAGLRALHEGRRHHGVVSGRAGSEPAVAFLFGGQGSQRPGMGAELFGAAPAYSSAFDEICALLDPLLGLSLRDLTGPDGDEDLLRQTRYAQPALFAVEVALYRLAESLGLKPDLLIGHSVGELAAAHVAGVFSLPDACELVAARGRLMQSAREGGAMAAFAASEEEAAGLVAATDGRVEVAAVNGPSSIVLAGDSDVVEELAGRWRASGRKASRLRVSHAFHSHHMADVLAPYREVLDALSFAPPAIPIVSTVTGQVAEDDELTRPGYWVGQLRQQVRFADAVRTAAGSGAEIFVELGGDGSLSGMTQETLDGGVTAVPLLRPKLPATTTVPEALGTAHVAGAEVDFEPLFPGGRITDLPTYPFETKRYWLDAPAEPVRPDELGVGPSAHPLLAAVVELPGEKGELFTGVLSPRTQPWLADHRIGSAVLVPAAVLLEMALAMGTRAGYTRVDGFAVHSPLVLDESAELQIQVISSDGEFTVRARAGENWTTHATAVFAHAAEPVEDRPWVAEQSGSLGTKEIYRLLAELGYEYGPAFQGLRWIRQEGDDIYAGVELPPRVLQESARYEIHPALLDAAMQALSLDSAAGPRRVPHTLDGVRLAAAGAVRGTVRLSRVDTDTYRLDMVDPTGRTVLVIERLGVRALPSTESGVSTRLYDTVWEAVEADSAGHDFVLVHQLSELLHEPPATVLLAQPDRTPDAGLTDDADTARLAIQHWLADERYAHSRLVFVTHGLPVTDDEPADPRTAAVWGLVRCAQIEHPGRFALVDTDTPEPARLAAAVRAGHGQVAVRGESVLIPRLRARPDQEDTVVLPRSARGGTVLVTGGTGALGRLIARHLVTAHGARELVLVSRRGEAHPDAAVIEAELAELGARTRILACDLTNRDAVVGLITGLGTSLTAVVHAAGSAEDAVVERLSAADLRAASGVKVAGARHLDELTRDLELDAFVAFGSVAGVVGTAGQSAYAAANAALEAVTRIRRRAGAGGVTIHWGLWDVASGMAGSLGERDVARLASVGIKAMPVANALASFDQALGVTAPAVVAADLDLRAVNRSRVTELTRARVAGPDLGSVEARPVPELVLDAVASVLGHAGRAEIDPELAFAELGFDSLMAVELRNRLTADLGIRLRPTIVFDHPTPAALIRFVTAEAGGAASAGTEPPSVHSGPADDEIAIVGMACRFPGGAANPRQLWDLLESGTDSISEFPADRGWDPGLFDPDPEHAGTSYTRYGGFLHDAADFDPEFFGISPREALAVDPQQRLLLQTAWEAVEDAGIDPASLRGSRTGVFAGVMYSDYGARVHQRRGAAGELEGYLVSGSAGSVASGRVSYTLGLEGPAVTIDTACSSSLVAVHNAARSLQGHECDLALAGGATVMASPATFVEFSRQRGLAPDGRCKPFSVHADGTAWAEGAGLLLLERLSDARRNGHRVLAVVKGSAVNQDGASNGLTAPSGPAQERVIRAALRSAGLRSADVDVLEAHGTGTRLGDPIEAEAVLATYGRDRGDRPPLVLGSVKSNLGHTQAAAGVAGIMKMVLAMRAGVVPGTLHVDRPTGEVDWSGGTVSVAAERTGWPVTTGPRRAAVSAFGISGTNAHVILEQGADPGPEPAPAPTGKILPWVLSSRTRQGLRAQAARLRAHVLDDPGLRAEDVAFSLATTRTAFAERAVVLGRDREELLAGLESLISGEPVPSGGFPAVITGAVSRGGTAVMFTGQGSQRPGMGTALHREFPVYAETFDAICAAFQHEDGLDLRAVIDPGAGDDEDLVHQTRYTQPALFALEVALYRLLESWGLSSARLTGHSIGEVAAAHVSGALSLPDAVKLVAARGRLMQQLPAGGAMFSVRASQAVVEWLIGESKSTVDIAAVNGPNSVVISGAEAVVTQLAGVLADLGHRVKRLVVSHAFHSALMEPMLDDFRAAAGDLRPGPMTGEVVSTLTGVTADATTLGSAEHWADHARHAVRFADALAWLRSHDTTVFLELGPDAALTAMAEDCDLGEGTATAAVLNRKQDDLPALWGFVARAFVAGVTWDWPAMLSGTRVSLPTYAFSQKRLWLDAPGAEPATAAGLGFDDSDHPLIAAAVSIPGGQQDVYTSVLSLARQPWLADHALRGTPLVPAAATVELAGWIARQHSFDQLEELTLAEPLPVTGDDLRLRISVDRSGPEAVITVHSQREGPEWTLNAEARTGTQDAAREEPEWASQWPPRAPRTGLDGIYERLAAHGYDYGPAFQGLRALWRSEGVVFAEVELPDGVRRDGEAACLFDAALHARIVDTLEDGRPSGDRLDVPHSWRHVRVHATPSGRLRVRITSSGEGAFALDVADEQARPVLSVGEILTRPIDPHSLTAKTHRPHEVAWVPGSLVAADSGIGTSVLDLRGSSAGGEVAEDARAALHQVLGRIRETVGSPQGTDDALVVITGNAVAAGAADRIEGLAQAAVWGLVRTAQNEYPGRVRVIDADEHESSLSLLPQVIAAGQPQVALRRGEILLPRLRPVSGSPAGAPGFGNGTVLLTGAGGGLGGILARHLLTRHGARHLLLASRRGDRDPALRALVSEMDTAGATVTVAACDIADPEALAALLAGIPAEHPLTAVVHAAGVLDDAVLETLTAEQLDRVLRPKIDAAWNLHTLTAGLPLEAFVLLSSVAGVVGATGQAAYAAGNTFLDAFAQHRRATGLPGTSLALGLWDGESGGGMASELRASDRARIGRLGIRSTPATTGLELFDRSVADTRALLVPVLFDTRAMNNRNGELPDILADLVPAKPKREHRAGPALPERIAGLAEDSARDLVADTVRARIAEVLGLDPAARVPDDRGLFDLGLDSLTAVELRNKLGADMGLRLPATLLFDQPAARDLVDFLLARCGPGPVEVFDAPALDGWVASAAGKPDGDERRAEFVRALKTALGTLERPADAGGEPFFGMDSASDDEIFGLLDRELND
ncbi:SDR family NAD(P)-dependent oxidoreductase [Amycolatopsis sp. GM8]|uniref:SDR family NAD(P)-dependent oxidoreductase n=1 Tax=Amycolatopsis sp. GM8 TaxID=2896530 RepID=UPI0035AC0C19